MSWTWDSVQITHDQTCWSYDGYNGCAGSGAGSGHPGIPHNAVIIYETLPVKTIKEVVKKVEKYKKETKEVQISPANVDAIVATMVDVWSKKDMQAKMELHDISQELAILSYRATLKQLIEDDDLALILIMVSI